MAVIALIQSLFQTLNAKDNKQLTGLSRQLYDKFFEVLVEESGHIIQRAPKLDDYLAANYEQKPDLIICTSIPEIGNVAPGFAELRRIRDAFPDTPIIVWSNRDEESIRKTALEDYKIVAYYTGILLNAPDDLADMVLEFT